MSENKPNVEEFEKSLLLEIFNYINERLKEKQLQLEMTIYGGTIMTILYDRPATKDIDCVFSGIDLKLLKNILDLTRHNFDLKEDWLDEQISEPLKYLLREDKEIFKTYSNLKILKPVAEQILAMKVLANRVEPAKDFLDASILLRELSIQTPEELKDVISAYVPINMIGE
jgi:hypothetical protein